MVLCLHGMEEVGVRFPVSPHGEVAEWFKATVLKTVIRQRIVSSNLTLTAK